MKRAVCFILVSIGLLMGVLLLPMTQRAIIEWVVKNYCLSLCGNELIADSVEGESKKLVYWRPRLDLGKGAFIEAERLDFHYEWQGLGLVTEMKWIKPVVHLDPSFEGFKGNGWLAVVLKTHVISEEGQLDIGKRVDFQFEAHLDRRVRFFGKASDGKTSLELKGEDRDLAISFDLHGFNSKDYRRIKPFLEERFSLFKSFEILDGEINGYLSLMVTDDLLMDGHLEFQNVALNVGGWEIHQLDGLVKWISNQLDSSSHLHLVTPQFEGDFGENGALQIEGYLDWKNKAFKILSGRYRQNIDALQGNLWWKEGTFEITDAEADYGGIHFLGDAEIRPMGEGLEILLKSHSITATVEDLKQVAGLIGSKSPFLKVPLQGQLDFNSETNFIRILKGAQSYQVEAEIGGELINGEIGVRALRLEDLSLHFAYKFPKNELKISEIQGSWITRGMAEEVTGGQDLSFCGDLVHIPNIGTGFGAFDVWVGDRDRDLFRGAGGFVLRADGSIKIELIPPDTHFGAIQPKQFSLVWGNELEEIKLRARFDLKNLIQDLILWNRIGGLSLPATWMHLIRSIDQSSGEIETEISYNGSKQLLEYHLHGDDLILNSHPFHHVKMEGRVLGKNEWILDQVELDQIALSGELFNEGDHFKIRFLGLRSGRALKLGMDGHYYPQSRKLDANIHLLEAKMEALSDVPFLNVMKKLYNPKGFLRGKGKMSLDFSKFLFGIKAQAHLLASIDQLEMGRISLGNWEDLYVDFSSEKGISVTKGKDGYGVSVSPIGDLSLFRSKGEFPLALTLQWKKKDDHHFILQNRDGLNLFGHPFEKMTAELEVNQDHVVAQHISFLGKKGIIKADHLSLRNKEGTWFYELPQVLIEHLQMGQTDLSLELQKVEGSLNAFDSLKGEGSVVFTQQIDENNSLLKYIPKEELEPLGLTPQTFIPVAGTIQYEISEGKIHLKKLKDVHTENKLLRYSLGKAMPSTIDFQGNLDLTLSVQPYNLLIKSTDLGTFQVGGTVKNPTLTVP